VGQAGYHFQGKRRGIANGFYLKPRFPVSILRERRKDRRR